MGPPPLCPARSPCQLASRSFPTGVIRPTPVTTTRTAWPLRPAFMRVLPCRGCRGSLLDPLLLQVVDGVADGLELLGVLVRDLDAELLLERHDQLDRIERVRAEVLDERSLRRHLLRLDAQLVHDDLLDLVRHILRHRIPLGLEFLYITMPPSTTSVCPVT